MMSDVQQPTRSTDGDPLPTLIRALRSSALVERLRAAKALGRLGWLAREATPALITALNDEDAKVRESAAHAIGQMGPESLPTLSGMLGHRDKYVRRNAVWALGKLGPLSRSALSTLCAALRDSDPRTASGAAQAIGNMGADGADAVAALADAMRGTNIVLCRLAAKALSQIGPPSLATLIAHLQHSDPFVRGESALAIGWMGALGRSAVPFLVQIVRGPRTSLTRTPPPITPLPGRASVTEDNSIDDEIEASNAPTPTQSLPTDGTPEENCRIHAAQALGRIGPSASHALDDLHEAARTGHDALRSTAQQSIKQILGTA